MQPMRRLLRAQRKRGCRGDAAASGMVWRVREQRGGLLMRGAGSISHNVQMFLVKHALSTWGDRRMRRFSLAVRIGDRQRRCSRKSVFRSFCARILFASGSAIVCAVGKAASWNGGAKGGEKGEGAPSLRHRGHFCGWKPPVDFRFSYRREGNARLPIK